MTRLSFVGLGRLREAAELSLVEVGDYCGVTRVTAWKWEVGEKRPGPKNRALLAALFGCTPRELANAIVRTRAAVRRLHEAREDEIARVRLASLGFARGCCPDPGGASVSVGTL